MDYHKFLDPGQQELINQGIKYGTPVVGAFLTGVQDSLKQVKPFTKSRTGTKTLTRNKRKKRKAEEMSGYLTNPFKRPRTNKKVSPYVRKGFSFERVRVRVRVRVRG
jgi:hypothetical protein